MTCIGRFAEAWQFASFFCMKSLLVGYDAGAAIFPATANFLTDPNANFLIHGGRANIGQVVYNLTRGTSGLITAISETSITATGVTWSIGDEYRVVFLNSAEIAQIEQWLGITAGDIHASLAAVGACDCTYSSWGLNFLTKVNIVEARTFFDCPCTPELSDAEKKSLRELVESWMKQIRSGEVDVCEGATGSLFPAIGFAEQASTEFALARILAKEIQE
jgi:hypothetical protein